MVFGIGYYSIMKGCLLVLDWLVDVGWQLLCIVDVGCGIVVLVMVVVWVFFVMVLVGDIDLQVVDVVQVNVIVNGLGGCVECVEVVGFDYLLIEGVVFFDLVFVNILKQLLIDFVLDMVCYVVLDGWVILLGILMMQVDEVIVVYVVGGLKFEWCDDYGEWFMLVVMCGV